MQIALICVLSAGLMPYLWTGVAKVIGPHYDNRDVRSWQSGLSGRAHRAHAAHLNSFEAFPLFAVAVLFAQFAGADAIHVNALAVAFVVLRLLYGVAYLLDMAPVRSLLWLAAMVCSVSIFWSAL